jgi:rare lipoprotein A
MLLLMSGCTSKPAGRYSIKQDTAPNFKYGEIEYPEIVPAFEPYNKWTSRPYKVLGKHYTPITTGLGFEQEGKASWYGQKFHGHKTANGEIFDMFALTAAHKTLPLPSFIKVSNLDNGKSAIVRVNDRGPFHGNRVLDLSYGAAKKLGYHKHGVARVKIEVIHVDENGDIRLGKNPDLFSYNEGELIANTPMIQPKPAQIAKTQTFEAVIEPEQTGFFVQVMAMSNGEKARSLATGLSNLLQVPNMVPKIANIYKLQLGPLVNEQKANNIIQELKKIGFEQAFTVEVSP